MSIYMERAVRPGRELPMSEAELAVRVELAACYRVFDMLGWTELIFNHITLRVPGPEVRFLINPFGLHYREITALNLVLIDIEGHPLRESRLPVNQAGFVIHSAIHGAIERAHCVMHTHTTTGCAVAGLKDGLSHDNFYGAMLHGLVAYHDFEGITVDPGEKERLVRDIGDKPAVILRNHGLLAWGPSVPEAFQVLWTLQRACDLQIATSAAGAPNPIRPEVIHLGHNRSVEEIVRAALQEDVQGIAVSSYQGGHLEFFKYMLDLLRSRGGEHVKLFGGGGGVIVPAEIKELQDYGVARVYSPEDGQRMGLQGMINDMLARCDFDPAQHAPKELKKGDLRALAQTITAIESGVSKTKDS